MKKFSKTKISFSILFFSVFISFSHAQLGIDKIKGTGNSYINTKEEIKIIEQKMKDKATQNYYTNQKTPKSFGVKNGLCLQFENGNIYYNYKTKNIFAIPELFLKKWGEIGWENGWLGFPISDVIYSNNNNNAILNFENGSILKSHSTGYHFLGGAFRDFWNNDGGINSKKLGFPKTDEVVINDKGYTRYQQFEFGTLFWGQTREVLYFPDANRTKPYTSFKIKLRSIQLNCLGSSDEIMYNYGKELQLYGFMDVAVFDEFGNEIKNIKNTPNSLLNTNRNNTTTVTETGSNAGSVIGVDDRIWQYDITSLDIENGYIRITYNFNDKDFYSSDDYLQLQGESGRWNYRNGSFKYRDIKLKELYNQKTTNKTDLFKETSQILNVIYSIHLYDLSN